MPKYLICGLSKRAMTAEAGGRNVDRMQRHYCMGDGGRPFRGGLQDQPSNRPATLGDKLPCGERTKRREELVRCVPGRRTKVPRRCSVGRQLKKTRQQASSNCRRTPLRILKAVVEIVAAKAPKSHRDQQGGGRQPLNSSIESVCFQMISTGCNKWRDLLWEQRAGGSNPSAPTIIFNNLTLPQLPPRRCTRFLHRCPGATSATVSHNPGTGGQPGNSSR